MNAKWREDDDSVHQFGGPWTTQKLEVVGEYLNLYTRALRNQPFSRWYIDAYAGTGTRLPSRSASEALSADVLPFEEHDLGDATALFDGSARVALKTIPPFDRFVFIEQEPARCQKLETLRQEFPSLSARIRIVQADANETLQSLHGWDNQSNRAVVFLDPYGMDVEWKTIQAIARTRAIDLWVLIPLGMGLVRLLPHDGEIPAGWARRLDRFLGTEEWRRDLYEVKQERNLFGEVETTVSRARIDRIGRYVNDRLKLEFTGVAEAPGILRNSQGTPLYLLCFAASNPKGAKVALRIASHLLKRLS